MTRVAMLCSRVYVFCPFCGDRRSSWRFVVVVRVCAVVDAYTCHTLLLLREPPAVLCCLSCVVEWLNLSNQYAAVALC
jgi:hypothetical protein